MKRPFLNSDEHLDRLILKPRIYITIEKSARMVGHLTPKGGTMKRIRSGITLSCLGILIAACSTAPSVPSNVPHTHSMPYVVSLGERHLHAAMDYNPQRGEVIIRFFDEDEIPYQIFEREKAKAAITMPTGAKREFYLVNPEAEFSYVPSGSYRYAGHRLTSHVDAKEKWLKNLQDFKLDVWLPVGSKVYEASFSYPK